jgi:hypothetical protein
MWEIARLGYTTQGNEFSYYMLIVGNFVLNQYVTAVALVGSANTY